MDTLAHSQQPGLQVAAMGLGNLHYQNRPLENTHSPSFAPSPSIRKVGSDFSAPRQFQFPVDVMARAEVQVHSSYIHNVFCARIP